MPTTPVMPARAAPEHGAGGQKAERTVYERLRDALPSEATVYPNVAWIGATRPGGPARDGEVDDVIVHPDQGLLLIEVKSGPVSRDSFGRWYAGDRDLRESPFTQAAAAKFAIRAMIVRHSNWPGDELRLLHAVAFPDTDRASITRQGQTLGPDAPTELVLDRADFESPEATREALERVWRYWSGDGSRDRHLSEAALATIREVIEPSVVLRPLLRGDIEEGEREMLAPTSHQLSMLRTLRADRRVSIIGGAGSGKTLLAAEKARELAFQGFNVLFVCFNQPLAHSVASLPELRPFIASGRLTVTTFHELCRHLGAEAGTLPPQPANVGPEWFAEVLPRALERAIPTVGGHWQALIVDEGQDFDPSWLESLDLLLASPGEGVLYLFHDPAQSLYQPDRTAVLGLVERELADNCRNALPIHEFAYRWYTGPLKIVPLRDDCREPELIEATPGAATVDALGDVLERLVKVEGVDRRQIAVLTGVSLDRSVVWKQHRFKGNLVLWNGGVDTAGTSLKLPADRVAAQPADTILCETIHRFKGLEREVVVLVELRHDDERLGKLLYIGGSRAKHHLIAIVTPELSQKLGKIAP